MSPMGKDKDNGCCPHLNAVSVGASRCNKMDSGELRGECLDSVRVCVCVTDLCWLYSSACWGLLKGMDLSLR